MSLRKAHLGDVETIRKLINEYAELGVMLFRTQADIYSSIRDFQLFESNGEIIGCCALEITWSDLAEIKSLSVSKSHQGKGIGKALVQAMIDEAKQLHLPKVFCLTLEKHFFEKLGFTQVAMDSLPLKVWKDCIRCSKQDNCDEIAMVLELEKHQK